MNASQTQFATQVAAAHRAGQPKPIASSEWSLTEAYDIQSAVVQELGGEPMGFKAALSTSAAQATFGLSAPVLGVLLPDAEVQSGFELAEMATPMIEIEMGFQLGASLTAQLSPEDFNQVFMSTVMMIDLADVGFVARPAGIDLVTSNAAGGRFLRGTAIQCNDPNQVVVELEQDGETINSGKSGDIGDQRALAVWLVNQALSLGYELRSGMFIMTGAIGQILPAKPGHFEARYGDLGKMSFDLR